MVAIIKVNGRDFTWRENLSIEDIMDEKKYTFPKIIVKVNDKHIEKEEYSSTIISDGDNVQMIHLLAGG